MFQSVILNRTNRGKATFYFPVDSGSENVQINLTSNVTSALLTSPNGKEFAIDKVIFQATLFRLRDRFD